MRPLTSSSLPIDGMLLVTLISRRGDQNPASIVTACTGTLCSFAYGDLARFRIPWSRHCGVVVSATELCAASRVPIARVKLPKSFCAPGSTEIAEADIAEATNFLREYFPFMATLPETNLRSHGAHHSATRARCSGNRYAGTSFLSTPLSVPFSYKISIARGQSF